MSVVTLFDFLGETVRRFFTVFDGVLLPFFLLSVFFLAFKVIHMCFPIRSDLDD